jgi:hypothetical protein
MKHFNFFTATAIILFILFASESKAQWNNGTNIFNSNPGNVGVGTGSTVISKFQVNNGSVLFNGTTGTTPLSGAGTRFMWIPSKAAFRVGSVTSTEWDDANIGLNSISLGSNKSLGASSMAIGMGNITNGIYSTAVGNSNTIDAQQGVALGQNNGGVPFYNNNHYYKRDYYPANQYQPNNPITISAQNSLTVGDATYPFKELQGADFTFQAGNSVTITPGFAVESGANLNVQIAGCATQLRTAADNLPSNATEANDANHLNPIQNKSGAQISLYPNPSNSQITLDYDLGENSEISMSIVDLFGKTVLNLLSNKQQKQGHYNETYLVNEILSGVYIFIYKNGNYVETKRMVILK